MVSGVRLNDEQAVVLAVVLLGGSFVNLIRLAGKWRLRGDRLVGRACTSVTVRQRLRWLAPFAVVMVAAAASLVR